MEQGRKPRTIHKSLLAEPQNQASEYQFGAKKENNNNTTTQ